MITKGIRSLKSKVKNSEALILCTDKTGKSAMVSQEVYKSMGLKHTSKDKKISWQQVEEIQHQINGHTASWLRMSCAGQTEEHEDKFRSTCLSQASATANM